MTVNIKTSGFG